MSADQDTAEIAKMDAAARDEQKGPNAAHGKDFQAELEVVRRFLPCP
jgi:hypothetical protein